MFDQEIYNIVKKYENLNIRVIFIILRLVQFLIIILSLIKFEILRSREFNS
jgi:hypothetical protein